MLDASTVTINIVEVGARTNKARGGVCSATWQAKACPRPGARGVTRLCLDRPNWRNTSQVMMPRKCGE